MRIQDLRTPRARTTHREDPLAEAARVMCDEHIGALVVVDRNDTRQRPIGILTDRDIVSGQLRCCADLYCLTVGDVMSLDPLVLPLHLELTEAIEALNVRAVRRAPLIDASGALVGIVTLDDLLPAVAQELSTLAALMGAQARDKRGRLAQRLGASTP
ncbi:MAG TPA: CBS domain-containing protein [Steroidobacteraceae bacterium]|nr:CBS domain-containing protein [Steroidobacteraceae bacterium]